MNDEANVRVNPPFLRPMMFAASMARTLTEEVAYRIGRAAAQYLNVPEIAVGRDMRISSPQLAAA